MNTYTKYIMAAALLSSLLVSCKKEAVDVEVIRQMPDKVVVNPAQIPGNTIYNDVVYTAEKNVRVGVGCKAQCPVQIFGEAQAVYIVDDDKVAIVDDKGMIEGKSVGSTAITVMVSEKELTKVTVECYAYMPSITVGKNKIDVTSAEYSKKDDVWSFYSGENLVLKVFMSYGPVYCNNIPVSIAGFELQEDEKNVIVDLNISGILQAQEEAVIASFSIPYVVKD